jgi:hypothetical protein
MTHTFLLEPGSWLIKGTWSQKNKTSILLNGAIIITWEQSNWFFMKTKMVFPNSNHAELTGEYKGCLPSHKNQYAYVLKRSDYPRIEGEGWVSNDSIVKTYWVLNDERKLHGFETFLYLDDNTYHLISGMMTGNHLLYTFEGVLKRHG